MADITVEFVESDSVTVDFVESDSVTVAFDGSATVIAHAATHLPGAGDDLIGKTWGGLAVIWTEEPTLEASITGGDVYKYTYGTTIYYRFVPDPYDSTEDKFYSSFSNPTLSGLIATRGASI